MPVYFWTAKRINDNSSFSLQVLGQLVHYSVMPSLKKYLICPTLATWKCTLRLATQVITLSSTAVNANLSKPTLNWATDTKCWMSGVKADSNQVLKSSLKKKRKSIELQGSISYLAPPMRSTTSPYCTHTDPFSFKNRAASLFNDGLRKSPSMSKVCKPSRATSSWEP